MQTLCCFARVFRFLQSPPLKSTRDILPLRTMERVGSTRCSLGIGTMRSVSASVYGGDGGGPTTDTAEDVHASILYMHVQYRSSAVSVVGPPPSPPSPSPPCRPVGCPLAGGVLFLSWWTTLVVCEARMLGRSGGMPPQEISELHTF